MTERRIKWLSDECRVRKTDERGGKTTGMAEKRLKWLKDCENG